MELLQKSLKMQRSLHGDRAHPGIAATLQKLGDLAAQRGDLKQGIKSLQKSLQMQRSLHGDSDHPGIAATLHKLADATAQSGDVQTGMDLFQESLRMQQSLHGDCDLGMAITLYKLGDLAICTGDAMQGIEFFEHSLQMQRLLHGDRAHPGIAVTLRKLGDVMAQTGNIIDSMRCLLEALSVLRSLHGEIYHPHVADALHSLGTANQRAGDFQQAEKFFQESLRMKGSLFADKKHPSIRLTSTALDEVRMTAQIANKFKAIRDLVSFKEEGLVALTRDTEAMFEATSQIEKIAREILSKLQKPTSEHAESEDKAQGSVYDIFGQILADAEDMSKPDLATNPDVHATWAAACTRMIFASQKAAEMLKRVIDSKGHSQKINASALRLGGLFEDECADTADATPHEVDFHSFVLSEASLIRQLAKKIPKVHGAQPAAELEARNRQTIYSKPEVTRAITEIKEDLLRDFIWETKGARKSEQDSIIHATYGTQGLVKPSGLSAAKTSFASDDEASTASFPETIESSQSMEGLLQVA